MVNSGTCEDRETGDFHDMVKHLRHPMLRGSVGCESWQPTVPQNRSLQSGQAEWRSAGVGVVEWRKKKAVGEHPRLEHCRASGVVEKIGELPHRRTEWSPWAKWRPAGVGGGECRGAPRAGGPSSLGQVATSRSRWWRKSGSPQHRRTKGLLRPSGNQVKFVNLPEFADQKNAGQALGASGCDRLRECKCLHNTIQRRLDGIEACGGLNAQLQAVEQTGCFEGEGEVWLGRLGATLTERCEQSYFHPRPHSSPSQRWVCP